MSFYKWSAYVSLLTLNNNYKYLIFAILLTTQCFVPFCATAQVYATTCHTRHFYNNSPFPWTYKMRDVAIDVANDGGKVGCTDPQGNRSLECVIPPHSSAEIHPPVAVPDQNYFTMEVSADEIGYKESFTNSTHSCYTYHSGNTGAASLNEPANGDVSTCRDEECPAVNKPIPVTPVGEAFMIHSIGGNCVASETLGDGARILSSLCSPNKQQRWQSYSDRTIRNESGKCLDRAEGALELGTPLILWPCNGQVNQQWRLSGKDNFRIIAYSRQGFLNLPSERGAGVSAGSSVPGTPLIIWDKIADASDQFFVKSLASCGNDCRSPMGEAFILNSIGGNCLGSTSMEDGSQVFSTACSSNQSTIWQYFTDRTLRNGGDQCLARQGQSMDNGTAIIVTKCNGQIEQRWSLTNGAKFRIIAYTSDGSSESLSERGLGISGGNAAPGTPVILWDKIDSASDQLVSKSTAP